MFTHIAIFKWKAGAEKSEVQEILQKIEALQEKIPGIIEITTAENQSPYGEGYTHVVFVRGQDAESLEAYRKHPEHVAIVKRIEAIEDHGIGIDFEARK